MTPEERYALCHAADRCTEDVIDCTCGRQEYGGIARIRARQAEIDQVPGPLVLRDDLTAEEIEALEVKFAHLANVGRVAVPAAPDPHVRISPDGQQLAWYRPNTDDGDDAQPWLVITEDPIALGVQHDWVTDADVADWTVLHPLPRWT